MTGPANNSITNDNTIYLEWNTVVDGVLYQVQVDNVWDFSSVAVDYTSGTTSYTTPILVDGIYYWRVRAADDLGNWSEWSLVELIIIDTTNPVINHPEDISYDVGSIGNNFTWVVSDINLAEIIVYIDGTEFQTVNVTGLSGIEYLLYIDGLDVGTYNYTIYVTDLAQNSFTDTVIVTVLIVIPEFSPITGIMLLGLCAVISLYSLRQIFKNKKR